VYGTGGGYGLWQMKEVRTGHTVGCNVKGPEFVWRVELWEEWEQNMVFRPIVGRGTT